MAIAMCSYCSERKIVGNFLCCIVYHSCTQKCALKWAVFTAEQRPVDFGLDSVFYVFLVIVSLVVVTNALDCLERLVSEMIFPIGCQTLLTQQLVHRDL